MAPVPNRHLIYPERNLPEQGNEPSVQPGAIPSGIEAGLAFAFGTSLSACSVQASLAAAALISLNYGGWIAARRFLKPRLAHPAKKKIAWLYLICGLGWFSHESAQAPSVKAHPRAGHVLREKTFAGTVRGTVSNLPIVRQQLFASDSGSSMYAEFKLKTSTPGQLYLVRAGIEGDQLPAGLRPGVSVEVIGKIYPQRPRSTPTRKDTPAAIIQSLPGSLTFGQEPPSRPSLGLRIRWPVVNLIRRLYSDKEQGLFCALITGEKRLLSQELSLLFVETGTVHFLAISGLHVGLIMAFAMRIPFPQKGRTILRLIVLGLFVLLSGANTPVLRAAIMIGLHLLLQAAGRLPRALDTLGWTLLALLITDPLSISKPGFQLSFIATIAILGWNEMRTNDLRERSRLLIPSKPAGAFSRFGSALFFHIQNSLWVAVISTAVTAPLIATYFHRVHPVAPLLSVCLYPLIAMSLLLGLSSILLGLIWIEAGFLAADAATVFARMLNGLLVFSRNIPGHCFNLPPPGFAMVSIFYLLLGAGISKKTRGVALLLSILVLPITLIMSLAAGNEDNPRLIHLDAGAGSAALLELPGSKRAFLIDACGKTRTGSWRLVRTLLDKGHRRIDGVILTHPHVDHAGALPVLTRSLDVGEVFCSEHFEREEYGVRLLADARKKGVRVSKVRRGQLLRLPGPEDIVLRIIYPDQTENLPLAQHANEMSLSFFIEIGQKRILCLGDLEEDGLARLFETGEDLNSEVLILPHHGRSNCLYDTLLEKVSPTTVVVSGDGQGQAEETLLRIELSGIKAYATWRGGSIQNEWNTGGIKTSYVDR